MERIGLAGKVAKAFITSKLTPIIIIASLLLGMFALYLTPREEEPQIIVPMVDVMVEYPGASAKEVRQRVTKPMEEFLWEIKGVEYIYSIVKPGYNLTIVRFYVGEDVEKSIVKLYNKLMSNYDKIPPGVSKPLVKPKSIDDVPIASFTLWSKNPAYSGYELRRIAQELTDELKRDNEVSEISIIGGQKRQVRVEIDPARLENYSVTSCEIVDKIQKSNFVLPSGTFKSQNKEYLFETGSFIENIEDVNNIVVGVKNNKPVYLKNIANVRDTAEEAESYVFMGTKGDSEQYEGVTIALSKKKGSNATDVSNRAIKKIEKLKGNLFPDDVEVSITRNYGKTARDKGNELLTSMIMATMVVVIVIMASLGRREAIVVAVAIPVTIALTMFFTYFLGYTINRVVMFALIFSIGILVDDAIVVVENIHRHFRHHGISVENAVRAVDEVGNPNILSTFTIIAALLPMAFVSGLMGPYMRPIPIGASAAIIFSTFVAFIITPWLSYLLLKNFKVREKQEETSKKGKIFETYEKILTPFIKCGKKRLILLGSVVGLFLLSFVLILNKSVVVKMLPFDNKSELQVIIDMPEGSPLEKTAALTRELSEEISKIPEVTDYQSYIGTAAPYNFNGLVRHYYLRKGGNVADIQVNFIDKNKRNKQSHDLARLIRPKLRPIADKYNARVKVAEIPPGPPVLSTIVIEVYGPDAKKRREIARDIRKTLEQTDGVVDVDWFVEDDQKKYVFEIDKKKARLNNISSEEIAKAVNIALGGHSAGLVHFDKEKEPVEIFLRLPQHKRTSLQDLKSIKVKSNISLSELGKINEEIEDKAIYHKNLRPVTYVIADLAGAEESPVYAMLNIQRKFKDIKQYYTRQPELINDYSIKWDGEWHITYEVFRDMGIAFAIVLILIYVLVVGWFKDFITPLIIMTPIPLTLVGIIPGHWMFGAFFTATSMIGFIALAGIIVRNSILLIDFIQAKHQETGNLGQAVIEASAVRFLPIFLTAITVVAGSFVMLSDPIFQGLAISLMFGAVVSTILTLITIPVLYYELSGKK